MSKFEKSFAGGNPLTADELNQMAAAINDNDSQIASLREDTETKISEIESYTTPLARPSWIANGIWINYNNKHIIFPVLPNSLVEIEVEVYGYYTFLADYITPVIGEQPIFADGYNDRVSFSKSEKVTAPIDAKYLYILYDSTKIKSVKIDGIERYTTLDWVVTEIADELEKVKPDVEDLKSNAIKENEFSYVSATSNIADPDNIANNKMVNNGGSIFDIEGWSIIKVNVKQGEILTFGGFYLGRSGYYAFYKDSELVSSHGFIDPQGVTNPQTVEVPSDANILYIDIQSTASPSNPYETLQINYGNVLKPYEKYIKEISHIKGIPLNGVNSESEGSATIADLMIDLPVSDGSDIASGFAYIDSQTNNIKVK